ncbi:GGDEF domain-containing protein [Rheinheimera sp. UJ63]|uniref:GGDEF domain-containing protein n=1 Tax=Rheinheimera sp. UJ63 TaxID=2910157 RepID=UPI001F2F60FE|nr:GGDEF domain-containing protein [Rheinheimera sp. UJ63]MCF4010745.1 GGDEF domain-containing protein [Rheinheimera sp. UJ63]
MKYKDTMQQATDKAAQVAAFLKHNQLAAHPTNYTVGYEYISGNNNALCQAIEEKLAAKARFDDFIMAELYNRHLLPEQQQQEQLLQDVSGMVTRLSGYTDLAAEATEDFIDQLDHTVFKLEQDAMPMPPALAELKQVTLTYRKQQQQLNQQLVSANQQSHQLRNELEQIKQQRLQDPLTGLYNRVAMQSQVDLWLSEQPDRQIAAIAVDLDHFSRFNQDYGHLIGDIILSKVATKVRSYVQESGLPVRAGGEQFLLLLPDVDLRTANEIAEQVRKGVEKLRFISAKDKKSLPKITISLGVALYQSSENWYQFLARTDSIMLLAKQRGRNQVASESMLAFA